MAIAMAQNPRNSEASGRYKKYVSHLPLSSVALRRMSVGSPSIAFVFFNELFPHFPLLLARLSRLALDNELPGGGASDIKVVTDAPTQVSKRFIESDYHGWQYSAK